MWLVVNTTPYAAERSWVQDKDANKIWLVVVKATFDISEGDGVCRLADEQAPVLRMAEPTGVPGSSIKYDADLNGVKTGTDVLVVGNAWAPAGRTKRSVDVQIKAGPISKELKVFGDRVWQSTVGLVSSTDPEPFECMPLTYERAYGGWDKSSENPANHRLYDKNPVGTGFAVSAESCLGKLLPNIEYPDRLVTSWKDRPPPAGLNAIECHWSPRRELAGTYDEEWRKDRFPLWAADFDPKYSNCAPADQQAPGFFRGGEIFELTNLSARGHLRFALPRIYPVFQTHFGNKRVEHRAQLCSVVVEPDIPRVLISWQTTLVCNRGVDELDATVVSEKQFV